MSSDSSTYPRISRFAFVIAGASFIPLLGIPFGLVAIVWGLSQLQAGGGKAAAIGASGIGFSLLLYGGLFYFGFIQEGGVYDDLRADLAQSTLTTLVSEIELHRVQHGEYPPTLEELVSSSSNETLMIYDPSSMKLGAEFKSFEYEVVEEGAGYRLFGVGPDGQPGTGDDLHPDVEIPAGSTLGLRLPGV